MPEKPPAADARNNIESVLHEDRKFECPEPFRQQAHIKSLEDYERIYRESVEQPEKFWGGIANELHWFKKWDKVLEWKAPWAKWFVGGQLNISYNCLDRHVQTCAQEQGRDDLGGRTRRSPHPDLPATASRSAEVRQRPEVAGRQERRPGRHLHGHDSRAAHRHAGLRPHRRAAHRGLRRILLQRSGRPHSRLAGRRRHHPGRLVPPRRRGQTISRGRGGAEVLPVGEARGRLQAHRHADQHAAGPRSLVARTDGDGLRRLSRRAARRRAPALHPLHLRNHRQAEGRGAHHRRLFRRHLPHHEVGLRSQGRRHLLVHRRHRLGHRAQLHRLRTAAERRHLR